VFVYVCVYVCVYACVHTSINNSHCPSFLPLTLTSRPSCLQFKLFIAGLEPVFSVFFSPDDDRIAGLTEGKIMVFRVDQKGQYQFTHLQVPF